MNAEMNYYLRRAKHEQEMGRYWAALSRMCRENGQLVRATRYQIAAANCYRDGRVYMEYANE